MALAETPQRQLDIGPASWFRPEAAEPPANQLIVKAGASYLGAYGIRDAADQNVAFAVVASGAGWKRYDLVYVDNTGTAQVLQGTEVLAAAAAYEGAPGWIGAGTPGPDLPDNAVPVAWVLIDELATVVVDITDIKQIDGFLKLSRDINGYEIDKGKLSDIGAAPPSGSSTVVTGLFAGETAGGSATARGVITSAPTNYVHITDQNNDEIVHKTVPGSKVYGRITEAAGVWTLTYNYLDASGTEQTVGDISSSAEIENVPTDLKLIGVPKTYANDDPSRPLFPSSVRRLSDQVAGDIPDATTTVKGKAQFAVDGGTGALTAVQGSDSRLGRAKAVELAALPGSEVGPLAAGVASGLEGKMAFIQGAGISIDVYDDPTNDQAIIVIAATGTAFQRHYQEFSTNWGTNISTGALGFTPEALILLHASDVAGFGCLGWGMATGTLTSQQQSGCLQINIPLGWGVIVGDNAHVIVFDATWNYSVTAWGSANIVLTANGPSASYILFGALFVFGK